MIPCSCFWARCSLPFVYSYSQRCWYTMHFSPQLLYRSLHVAFWSGSCIPYSFSFRLLNASFESSTQIDFQGRFTSLTLAKMLMVYTHRHLYRSPTPSAKSFPLHMGRRFQDFSHSCQVSSVNSSLEGQWRSLKHVSTVQGKNRRNYNYIYLMVLYQPALILRLLKRSIRWMLVRKLRSRPARRACCVF